MRRLGGGEEQIKVVGNEFYVEIAEGIAITNRIKVPFSYGDATPKLIAMADGLIKRASIIILTPFNGAASTLSLGDDLNLERLIPKSANNPSATAEYETSPLIQYPSATAIKLKISPGEGCTAGKGIVILEV